jgi:hypothetical protein
VLPIYWTHYCIGVLFVDWFYIHQAYSVASIGLMEFYNKIWIWIWNELCLKHLWGYAMLLICNLLEEEWCAFNEISSMAILDSIYVTKRIKQLSSDDVMIYVTIWWWQTLKDVSGTVYWVSWWQMYKHIAYGQINQLTITLMTINFVPGINAGFGILLVSSYWKPVVI